MARAPGAAPAGAPGRVRPAEPTRAVGTRLRQPPLPAQVPPASRPAPYIPQSPPGSPAPPGPQVAGGNGKVRAKKKRSRQQVVRDVRNRRLVRRVDVWSVLKVSLIFYLCLFVAFLAAGVVLWNAASDFGVIGTVDKLIRSLFALSSFKLHALVALAWGASIAGLLCFLGLLFNVAVAVLYNLISDVVGGIQVIVVSDEDA